MDSHRSYAGALREIGAAVHNALPSVVHEGLEGVDSLHSNIRAFLKPFNGVSTRWLHLYLAWFKWLRSFKRSEGAAARHMVAGDYRHTWRMVRGAAAPVRPDGTRPPTVPEPQLRNCSVFPGDGHARPSPWSRGPHLSAPWGPCHRAPVKTAAGV